MIVRSQLRIGFAVIFLSIIIPLISFVETTAFRCSGMGNVAGRGVRGRSLLSPAPGVMPGMSDRSRGPRPRTPTWHGNKHNDPFRSHLMGNGGSINPGAPVGWNRRERSGSPAASMALWTANSGKSKASTLAAPPITLGEKKTPSSTVLPSAVGAALPGNFLQRIAPAQRSGASPPSASLSPTPRLLPSDPIERFSGTSQHSMAGGAFSLGSASAVPSLLGRLVAELRTRTFSGGEHPQGKGGDRFAHPGGVDQGLRELCSAIARVEARLSVDSLEASQLREALAILRSEKETYSREHTVEAARIEAITREYDDLRRRAAITEAELGRRDRRLRSADVDREKKRAVLSDLAGKLSRRIGWEEERFVKDMKTAARWKGPEGAGAVDDVIRAYQERARALSDSLASTHDQLETLKSDREREKREAGKTRKQLTAQVAQLEAQLKRAGEGVEQEKAEMESVLRSLSGALEGVDVELTQSAGMTPSRETNRVLRRAQEDFRRDQRRVKLLLEKQKQRYDYASDVMAEEAQRLRVRVVELNDLRAGLVESEGKEKRLKSSVSALGGRVSTLDRELRQSQDALSREQGLRKQAEAALLSAEELREQETAGLSRELEVTRDTVDSTRRVYESTVGQREAWRQTMAQEQRARKEAAERADASQLALRDEMNKHKHAAERRGREIAELKAQVVRASRSLALSKADKEAVTKNLEEKVNKLTEEASRLGAQAEHGKKAVASTVTGVASRAFRNASQVSRNIAPQGFISMLGDTINSSLRSLSVPVFARVGGGRGSPGGVSPDPTSPRSDDQVGIGEAKGRSVASASATKARREQTRTEVFGGFAKAVRDEARARKKGADHGDSGVQPRTARRGGVLGTIGVPDRAAAAAVAAAATAEGGVGRKQGNGGEKPRLRRGTGDKSVGDAAGSVIDHFSGAPRGRVGESPPATANRAAKESPRKEAKAAAALAENDERGRGGRASGNLKTMARKNAKAVEAADTSASKTSREVDQPSTCTTGAADGFSKSATGLKARTSAMAEGVLRKLRGDKATQAATETVVPPPSGPPRPALRKASSLPATAGTGATAGRSGAQPRVEPEVSSRPTARRSRRAPTSAAEAAKSPSPAHGGGGSSADRLEGATAARVVAATEALKEVTRKVFGGGSSATGDDAAGNSGAIGRENDSVGKEPDHDDGRRRSGRQDESTKQPHPGVRAGAAESDRSHHGGTPNGKKARRVPWTRLVVGAQEEKKKKEKRQNNDDSAPLNGTTRADPSARSRAPAPAPAAKAAAARTAVGRVIDTTGEGEKGRHSSGEVESAGGGAAPGSEEPHFIGLGA